MLSEWLNNKYVDEKGIINLRNKFIKGKPFPHIELSDFLKKEKAILLLNALSKEEFYQKESDLFKLSQTNDFVSTQNKILRSFRDFLCSKEFISFIHKITNENLKTGEMDCNGSIYQDTEYLLPHDDQLEGRNIAFIYYLTTLSENEGGALGLFSSKNKNPLKIVKRITPQVNKFAFFKVSDVSFHQVEEVVSEKQRISINGWFHGNK